MNHLRIIFREKSTVKTLSLLLLTDSICLAFQFDLLYSYRTFYLFVLPLLLPFLVSDANKYLYLPELVSRSNQPVLYFFESHKRRVIFIFIYSQILCVSSLIRFSFIKNNQLQFIQFVFLLIILFCIGLLISVMIDVVLLITKKVSVGILIVLSFIGFDYLLSEIGYDGVLYGSIYPIIYKNNEMTFLQFYSRIMLIIFFLAVISVTLIYSQRKSDYIQHPREA